MADNLPSEEVFHGQLISVRVMTLPKPSGGQSRFEVVEHPDAAAIVAVRPQRADDPTSPSLVALVRQMRPAVGRDFWELPAGLVEAEERGQPLLTARRELREETGAEATTWHLLVRQYTSPGFTNEAISIYLATDITLPQNAAPLDATEIAQVAWLPLDEAIARCRAGEGVDGKTLLGLILARDALRARAATESETAMPLDPTNMPQQRSVRYRDSRDDAPGLDTAEGDPHADGRFDPSLKLENMLLEEYNYANLTAYQAMEDRARLLTFYLSVVGILAGAAGAIYQLGNKQEFSVGLILVALGIIAVFGVAFFIQLVRLRQAYGESLLAMSAVKEYFIAHFEKQLPDIRRAFRWRVNTIPATERFASVTFVICAIVALVTALSIGGAVAVAAWTWVVQQTSVGGVPPWLQVALAGGIAAVIVGSLFVPFYHNSLDSAEKVDKAIASVNEVRVAHGLEGLTRRK